MLNRYRNTLKAHWLGKKYPRHVFLTYGNYEAQWWSIQDDYTEEDGSVIECSPEERAEILQYSLAALHYPYPYVNNASLDLKLNSSSAKVQQFIERRRHSYHSGFEFYHQCYDAALALALALNKTLEGRIIIIIPLLVCIPNN